MRFTLLDLCLDYMSYIRYYNRTRWLIEARLITR